MIFENGYWAYRPKIYEFLGISQDLFFEAPNLAPPAPTKKRKKKKREKKNRRNKKQQNPSNQVNPWDKSGG